MTRSPKTPAAAAGTPDDAAALLAALAAAEAEAEALTPKPRSKGPRKLRTYFDTAAILDHSKKLGDDADWLDLTAALGFDDDDDLNGPKLRTRLSQLANGGKLAENFRPIDPARKPLYLARKKAAALRAQAIAAGIIPADDAAADAAETTPAA